MRNAIVEKLLDDLDRARGEAARLSDWELVQRLTAARAKLAKQLPAERNPGTGQRRIGR